MQILKEHLIKQGLCGEIDTKYLKENTSWQQMKKNFKLIQPIMQSNEIKGLKKYSNISFRDIQLLSRLNKKNKNIYKLYCDNLEHDIFKVIINGVEENKFDNSITRMDTSNNKRNEVKKQILEIRNFIQIWLKNISSVI